MTTANCIAVPIISTGVGVAFGVQAAPSKMTIKPIVVIRKNLNFTVLLMEELPDKNLFGFLLNLRPCILEIHGQIKNRLFRCGVRIGAEVSLAFKLETVTSFG